MRTYALKSMTTLMSPLRCSSASSQRSRGTVRVISRASQRLSARERGRRRLVVPPIGIDRPEYGVVIEHHGAVEAADIDVEHLSGLRDTGQADDSGRRRRVETTADEGRRSRAFHQNVGSEPLKGARIAVVGPAEIAHERLLRTTLVVIEHMHVEIALDPHEGRQQPDG